MASANKVFPLGTRKSKLAMVQTEQIQSALQARYPDYSFPIIGISAQGDINQTTPLHQFSSNAAKGLWTEELEALLHAGECRLVVNSLKDLPTTLPDGFKISMVTERADSRDVVVMASHCSAKSLSDLPAGSIVGTSSIRRSAQIKRSFPHLQFADVRGNVGTRLSKLDDPSKGYSCLILAAAGLARLDLLDRATQYLEGPIMYQAPGQGALGVEILSHDTEVAELLAPLDHHHTRLCTWSERAMMRFLQGGCSVPIGCGSKYEAGILTLTGIVVSVDGTFAVEATHSAAVETDTEAEAVGIEVAQRMIRDGARQVLDEIELTRKREGDEAGTSASTTTTATTEKLVSADQAGLEAMAR